MTNPALVPQPLTSPTSKRLFAYSLVAGAGMFAAAQPAEAGVIYIDPADVTSTSVDSSIDIDLDGIDDLAFDITGGGAMTLFAQANGVLATPNSWSPKAAALSPSMTVGPEGLFTSRAKMASAYRWVGSTSSSSGIYGPFANRIDGYLGVRFTHDGSPVYGWVRLDVTKPPNSTDIAYTVKDWAYEDGGGSIHVGDTGGEVPEPGTLGMLALGSVALLAWRRRKKDQA